MAEQEDQDQIQVYPKNHRIADVVGLILTAIITVIMATWLGADGEGKFVVGMTVFYGLFITHGSLSGAFIIRRYNRKTRGRTDLQEIV